MNPIEITSMEELKELIEKIPDGTMYILEFKKQGVQDEL